MTIGNLVMRLQLTNQLVSLFLGPTEEKKKMFFYEDDNDAKKKKNNIDRRK